MTAEHEDFMRQALTAAAEAEAAGNVPVGSLIVLNGAVVGVGQNRASSAHDPTAHAEVDAIRDACRRRASTTLDGATCYTTMEPCPMCCWALQEAGIARLLLGARHAGLGRTDYGGYSVEALLALTGRRLEIVTDVLVPECEALRRNWPGRRAPGGGTP